MTICKSRAVEGAREQIPPSVAALAGRAMTRLRHVVVGNRIFDQVDCLPLADPALWDASRLRQVAYSFVRHRVWRGEG
ncbi:hypothetical protein CPLU01_06983 [Colletotrichum plurivorum]|uniref:Uncharacterized protein n=1 Tax=Colletotrichum plurivorum TaxID=2175906 RepID=A0A8H6NEY1_9PEZI|nr:hypothetical protein CPLU01_06983 [Colletotrichum plurivorum]